MCCSLPSRSLYLSKISRYSRDLKRILYFEWGEQLLMFAAFDFIICYSAFWSCILWLLRWVEVFCLDLGRFSIEGGSKIRTITLSNPLLFASNYGFRSSTLWHCLLTFLFRFEFWNRHGFLLSFYLNKFCLLLLLVCLLFPQEGLHHLFTFVFNCRLFLLIFS